MLAQLRNDPGPVEVVTDEYQFSHRPVRMRVRIRVAVMGCRALVCLAMGVMGWTVLPGMVGCFHGAGNTTPDPLH